MIRRRRGGHRHRSNLPPYLVKGEAWLVTVPAGCTDHFARWLRPVCHIRNIAHDCALVNFYPKRPIQLSRVGATSFFISSVVKWTSTSWLTLRPCFVTTILWTTGVLRSAIFNGGAMSYRTHLVSFKYEKIQCCKRILCVKNYAGDVLNFVSQNCPLFHIFTPLATVVTRHLDGTMMINLLISPVFPDPKLISVFLSSTPTFLTFLIPLFWIKMFQIYSLPRSLKC